MPLLIRAGDNHHLPLVEPGRGPLERCYFNLVRLQAGEAHRFVVPGCETLCVVLAGRADITVGATEFAGVGRRVDLWSGPVHRHLIAKIPGLQAMRDNFK